jgi:uncharacterized protein (DUF983 family)
MTAYRILVSLSWVLVAAVIVAPPSDSDMRQGAWVKILVWVPILAVASMGCRKAVSRRRTGARWLFVAGASAVLANLLIDYGPLRQMSFSVGMMSRRK